MKPRLTSFLMGQNESATSGGGETKKIDILTLFHAAKDGNVAKISRHLDTKGTDVNVTNRRGNTALHIACIHGQTDVVQLLLDKGANVNAQCKHGYSPLYVAAMENHPDVVQRLLANGADKDLAPEGDMSPYKIADLQGHVTVASLLRDPDEEGAEPG